MILINIRVLPLKNKTSTKKSISQLRIWIKTFCSAIEKTDLKKEIKKGGWKTAEKKT